MQSEQLGHRKLADVRIVVELHNLEQCIVVDHRLEERQLPILELGRLLVRVRMVAVRRLVEHRMLVERHRLGLGHHRLGLRRHKLEPFLPAQ